MCVILQLLISHCSHIFSVEYNLSGSMCVCMILQLMISHCSQIFSVEYTLSGSMCVYDIAADDISLQSHLQRGVHP